MGNYAFQNSSNSYKSRYGIIFLSWYTRIYIYIYIYIEEEEEDFMYCF